MKIAKLLIALPSLIVLSGCFEDRRNTEQLCNDHPELRCEKLNINDGQCRLPRTDLIWHRFEVHKNGSDANKIKEYALVSEYKRCLELASQIQPIDQNNVKQKRFDALMHSSEEQERIVSELSLSRSPETLYFLWSQTGDEDAQREFLQMEGSPKLETAEMQYALATFYTNRSQEKTLQLLNHALELSGRSNINTEIFKSLASTYYKENQRELAYIWAKVAESFEIQIVSDKELQLLYGFNKDKFQKLDAIADDVEEMVRAGKYMQSSLPTKFD